MKKIFTVSLLCLTVTLAFAQKPKQGDMGFTFGFNGLSTLNLSTNFGIGGSTLLFRHYVKDDLAVRARLNLNLNQNTNELTDTGTTSKFVTKNHSVNLNIGLQKDFALNMKRIQPYITGEILLGLGKNGISENTSTVGSTFEMVNKTDPGTSVSFGILSNVGFNYFFTDHLALGVEFGYGLVFSSTGSGMMTTSTTISGVTTNFSVPTPSNHSYSLSGTGGEGLIMFSVFFDHP